MEEMIMNGNEEVVFEVAERAFDSNKTLKTVAGIGVVVLVGGLTYKYAIKPGVSKLLKKYLKNKKEVKNEMASDDGIEIIEDFDNEEED